MGGEKMRSEVRPEGDYEAPLRPGMVLTIEQGAAPPHRPRVAFEGDVLVTEDGLEWLSRSIPIEIGDMEAMLRVESRLKNFVGGVSQPDMVQGLAPAVHSYHGQE
jgi:hypothetical protein